jgi:hypothetical protein
LKKIKIDKKNYHFIVNAIVGGGTRVIEETEEYAVFLIDSVKICPWLAMKYQLTVTVDDSIKYSLSVDKERDCFYRSITNWKEGTFKISINLEKYGI